MAGGNPVAGDGRRIRVLLNPTSGTKAGFSTNQTTEDAIRSAMRRHNLGEELLIPTSAAAMAEAAREAADLGYDVVVAAGGDGTAGLVATELVGRPTALGLFPIGSVMNVSRMLGIPRDMGAAAALVATGHVRAIDVGEAKGKIFLEMGSVGLNAAMFREAERLDAGDYPAIVDAVRVFLRYKPDRMVIHLDDRVLTTRALTIAIANGPFTGFAFAVAPEARLDDGRFDVVVFSRFSRGELARHFLAIAFGRRHYTPKTATYRSARVRVEAVRPLPCEADAEDLGTTPIEYVVRPAALRVIVPGPLA